VFVGVLGRGLGTRAVCVLTLRNTRSVVLVAATMNNKWQLAFVICATSCCVTRQQLAVHRASGEFRCPAPRIATRPRPDISDDVIDVRACGHIVRYSCFYERNGPHCVREPIDVKDIDAMMSVPVDSAPAPETSASLPRGLSDGPRMCRDWSDFNANRDCVAPDH
jgi:hypothetical protein